MSKSSKFIDAKNYMNFVTIVGCMVILLNLPDFSKFSEPKMIGFTLLCIIASNTSIKFKSGMNLTLTSPVAVFLLLLVSIEETIFIGCIGLLSYHIKTRRPLQRYLFNIAQYSTSLYVAGRFLSMFYDGTLNLPHDFLYILPAILLFETVNLLFVGIAIALENDEPIKRVLAIGVKETQTGMPLYLSNGLIMYICYHSYGFWGLLLIIIPLFSINWLLTATTKADLHKENALICPTTKLKNRRCLNEWLNNQFFETVQESSKISFILIDIDDFKKINDKFGHDAGDQVLTEFGEVIRNNIRDTDLIYRYGGEEFVVILPGFEQRNAHRIIERLHTHIRNYSFLNGQLQVTFSAGISGLDKGLLNDNNLNTANELIRRADMAMYSAKQSGKNQTKYYNQ